MKKHLPLLLLILCSASLFSQTATTPTTIAPPPNNWSKTDRNNLYEDCMAYIMQYKNLTNEQKESLSLCYMHDVTTKYTKDDFSAMIEIELTRMKESMIGQCAKNLGIALNKELPKSEPAPVIVETPKTASKSIASKEDLYGKWKADNGSIIEFKEGGKYVETTAKGKTRNGDWFLDENGMLTLNLEMPDNFLVSKSKMETHHYKVDYFSKDFLKYSEEGGDFLTIQMNRI